MRVGRAVGYGLLAVVDAVVPAVVIAGIAAFALLGHEIGGYGAGTLAAAAGLVTFVGTLAASTVSHARGGRPFAFTRLAKRLLHYYLVWPPWVPGRRRRR